MAKLYETDLNLDFFFKFVCHLPYQHFVFNAFGFHLVLKCLKSDNAFTNMWKQMVAYTDHTYQEYLYK